MFRAQGHGDRLCLAEMIFNKIAVISPSRVDTLFGLRCQTKDAFMLLRYRQW